MDKGKSLAILSDAIKRVKKIPREEVERIINGGDTEMKTEIEWISIESGERPRIKGKAFVYVFVKTRHGRKKRAFYSDEMDSFYGAKGGRKIKKPTHWAHLPEPPKEGG